jgi:hypothetical protein
MYYSQLLKHSLNWRNKRSKVSRPSGLKGFRRSNPNHQELLDCLARGWTKREIAEEYKVTLNGLHQIWFRLYRKDMGVRTPEQAIFLYAHNPTNFNSKGYWIPYGNDRLAGQATTVSNYMYRGPDKGLSQILPADRNLGKNT